MHYAILFTDDESKSAMRPKYMEAHLTFLEENKKQIQSAGPLRDANSGNSAGGLWVVNAESLEVVQQLIENDPFWPTGLRHSVQILEWTQVFAQGKRKIHP